MGLFDFLKKGETKSAGDQWQPVSFLRSILGEKWDEKSKLEAMRSFVYACVVAISDEVSAVQPILKRKTSKGMDNVDSHELLDLIQHPNPFSSFSQLLEGTAVFLELTGRAYWNIARDKRGRIQELWLLRPDLVKAKVKEDTAGDITITYEYRVKGKKRFFSSEEIVPFYYFNPSNSTLPVPTDGISPLEASELAVQTLEAANQWNRDFFKNGAVPDGVLVTETVLPPEERSRLIRQFESRHKGAGNYRKTGSLPRGVDYKTIGTTSRDMEYSELYKLMRDEILTIFRVPKSILGITDGTINRATAETQEYVFAKRVIEPKVKRIMSSINKNLVSLFDDNLVLDFESIIPNDKERDVTITSGAVGAGIMTINEARELLDLEPIKGGDSTYTPLSVVPQLTKEKQKGMSKKKSLIGNEEVHIKRWEAMVKRAEKYEKRIKTTIQGYFRGQKKLLNSRLQGQKGIDPNIIPSQGTSVSTIISLVTPLIRDIVEQEGLDTYDFLGITVDFSLSKKAIDQIEGYVKLFAKTVDETTRGQITDAISNFTSEAGRLDDLVEEIDNIYDKAIGYRSEIIARSESIRAANIGTEIGYQESGVVEAKQWLTVPDERRCEWCAVMEGVELDLGGSFFGKGETMTGLEGGTLNFNYSDIQVPPLHPQCRCTIIPIIK